MGEILISLAMAILLLAVASRCFLGELGFRTSPLRSAYALLQMPPQKDSPQTLPKELGEFSRVSISILLMGAFCLAELGRLMCKKSSLLRRGPLGWLAVLFIAISSLSALLADDLRSAWDGWLEQTSLVMMFLLTAGLCESKRRFAITAVVLAGLGAAMAAKGLFQVGIEIPARIAAYDADPACTLAQLGYRPGTPEAKLLESRVRDHTAIGFLPLANLFASMLMILLAAAAGLAADKISIGRKQAGEMKLSKGWLSPMSTFGVLAVLIAIILLAVLLMTRSRAGIVFAVAAGAVAIVAGIFRGFFSRFRWALVAAGMAIIVAGGAWLIDYGLKNDRLPDKSLTFRWFYWTASADIVRESGTATLVGVGPGNFPAAYLRHRRAEAEEAIKMPHNTLMHAAAEYGLVGGSVFVLLILLALLGTARKGQSASAAAISTEQLAKQPAKGWHGDDLPPDCWSGWERFLLMLVAPCAAAARVMLAGWGDSPLLDVILPAIALAAGLWIFGAWALRAVDEGPGFTRMAMGLGALALALHSLMEPSLWTPAPATLFWIAVGACIGQIEIKKSTAAKLTDANETSPKADSPDAGKDAPSSTQANPGLMRMILAGIFIGVTAVSVYYIWRPVAIKSSLNIEVQSAACAGDINTAIDYAKRAALADPTDRIATIDAARTILVKADRRKPNTCRSAFEEAGQVMCLTERKYAEIIASNRSIIYFILSDDPYRKLNHGFRTADKSWNHLSHMLEWWYLDDKFGNFSYPIELNITYSEKAINDITTLVKNNPYDPQANWSLGQMEYARGNFSYAYSIFSTVDKLHPNLISVVARVGDAAWNAGMKDQAFSAWKNANSIRHGIYLLLDVGDHEIENDPMDSRLRLEYARILLDLGWFDSASCNIRDARDIQAKIKAFNPESLQLFSEAEQRELETLEARAKFPLEYIKTLSTTQTAPASQPTTAKAHP